VSEVKTRVDSCQDSSIFKIDCSSQERFLTGLDSQVNCGPNETLAAPIRSVLVYERCCGVECVEAWNWSAGITDVDPRLMCMWSNQQNKVDFSCGKQRVGMAGRIFSATSILEQRSYLPAGCADWAQDFIPISVRKCSQKKS